MKFFNFAYVTGTHLSDEGKSVAKEISFADKDAKFNCIIHGGNALNGNNPEKISVKLLGMEYERFIGAVENKILLPVQGETDGWRNERFKGQLAVNILTDKVWDEDISFTDSYKGLKRKGDSPYYYMDFKNAKVRFIILCSYFYEYDEKYELFEKFKGFKAKQLKWLIDDALNLPKGYTAVIFSHSVPKSRFETGKDPFIYNSWSTEQNLMIIQQAQRLEGVKIAAWISGGYNKEEALNIGGINFITTKSLTFYNCSLTESKLLLNDLSVEY